MQLVAGPGRKGVWVGGGPPPVLGGQGGLAAPGPKQKEGSAEARGLGGVTLAREPLPAIGGFVLAQAVPEVLGEESP